MKKQNFSILKITLFLSFLFFNNVSLASKKEDDTVHVVIYLPQYVDLQNPHIVLAPDAELSDGHYVVLAPVGDQQEDDFPSDTDSESSSESE